MSPRTLILLCLVFASAGFAGAHFMVASKVSPSNPSSLEAGAKKADAANCESCKNTPTNRFAMLAKQEGKTGALPQSLRELETMARSQSGTPLEKRWWARKMLADASAKQLEEIIANFQNLSFRTQDPEYQFAVRRLAELDPQKAADCWAQNPSLRIQTDLFLKDWAKKDPAAFLAWNLTQTADAQKASASVLASVLKDAPEKLTELSSQLSVSASGPAAARAAMDGMRQGDKDNPDKAFSLAQSLPEGPLRNAALVELLKWPEAKASERPEVLAALAQIEPEEAKRLGRDLGKVAADLPAGVARDSAFISALREQTGKDPAAAAKRLDALAGSPDYAPAVRGFVDETVRKDPAAAADWALSIGESAPLHRISALERVAASWLKTAPDAARAWVEKAPISDLEYFQLTGRARQR
jgi:hypothetical protein